MERKFKKGDVVVLKSGGPEMTVNSYAWEGNYLSNETVVCYWFDNKNKRREGNFNQDTLKSADKSE